MRELTSESFDRPDDLRDRSHPAVLYALSLLLIRGIVGVLGVALPLILIVGEAFFLKEGVQVRGSLSAYYHTSMRDVFVACLSVIGFLLATYMAGQTNTRDFRYSLIAGIAVIGVVFFPMMRPDVPPGAQRCGEVTMPTGCSPIQQQIGEVASAWLHLIFAAIFILSLARLCFVFAYREDTFKSAHGIATTLRTCGWVIVAAVVGILVGSWAGLRIGPLTPLYIGEVVSVWAFGVAWLLKARDLRSALDRTPAVDVAPPGPA